MNISPEQNANLVRGNTELLVLAVKPNKLEQVAPQLGGASRVVSVLAATPLARLTAALPGAVAVERRHRSRQGDESAPLVAPAPGSPPKNPATMLPMPCPINSRLESC